MTKVIILSDETLDSYYDRAVQHLHDRFHTCPTYLTDQPVSAADAAQISYYDAMARDLAVKSRKSWLHALYSRGDRLDSKSLGGRPLGKVVF